MDKELEKVLKELGKEVVALREEMAN